MGWLFGGRKRVDKPPTSTVIPFPRGNRRFIPVVVQDQKKEAGWDFTVQPWETVDEVLYAARKDLHRGLTKGDSILIAIYDEDEDRLVWYQLGMSNEEVLAAFDEWRDAQ